MNLLYRFRNPLLWLAIACLTFFFTLQLGPKSPTGTIEVEVAPEGASLTIDGEGFDNETTAVTGNHTVEASKKGFASQQQAIALKEGQVLRLAFVLESNTPETADWYSDHPEDGLLAEGISSRLSDYNSEAAPKSIPLLLLLPYLYPDGAGGTVRVDHGVPVEGSSLPAIYITAPTPEARQDAVTWVRSQGYDPSTMDIVFRGEANPWGKD